MTINIQKPKAIFFDWDGTLVNTIPLIRSAHDHTRQAMGFAPWTDDEFQENLQYSSRDLYPKIYGENAEEAIKTLYEYVDQNHIEGSKFMPYAQSLIAYLAEKSIITAVISNKTHKYLIEEIKHLGVDRVFIHAVGAGHAVRDKPSPDPLLIALSDMGLSDMNMKDIWYVGDTSTDMHLAQNVGCHAILIGEGRQAEMLKRDFNPLLSFAGCLEMKNYLQSMDESDLL